MKIKHERDKSNTIKEHKNKFFGSKIKSCKRLTSFHISTAFLGLIWVIKSTTSNPVEVSTIFSSYTHNSPNIEAVFPSNFQPNSFILILRPNESPNDVCLLTIDPKIPETPSTECSQSKDLMALNGQDYTVKGKYYTHRSSSLREILAIETQDGFSFYFKNYTALIGEINSISYSTPSFLSAATIEGVNSLYVDLVANPLKVEVISKTKSSISTAKLDQEHYLTFEESGDQNNLDPTLIRRNWETQSQTDEFKLQKSSEERIKKLIAGIALSDSLFAIFISHDPANDGVIKYDVLVVKVDFSVSSPENFKIMYDSRNDVQMTFLEIVRIDLIDGLSKSFAVLQKPAVDTESWFLRNYKWDDQASKILEDNAFVRHSSLKDSIASVFSSQLGAMATIVNVDGPKKINFFRMNILCNEYCKTCSMPKDPYACILCSKQNHVEKEVEVEGVKKKGCFLICAESQYNSNFNTCDNCSPGCQNCKSGFVCDKCKTVEPFSTSCKDPCVKGAYEKTEDGKCSACSANPTFSPQCVSCSIKNGCEECQEKFIPVSKGCVFIDEYCQKDRQYVDSTLTCRDNPENCAKANHGDGLCLICDKDFFLNSSRDCQRKCPEPTKYGLDDSQTCYQCSEIHKECVSCSNFTTTAEHKCLGCNSGFFIQDDPKLCRRICQAKFGWDSSDNLCLKCPESCEFCSNDYNDCDNCEAGFNLVKQPTSIPKARCERNCGPGLVLNLRNNQCFDCSDLNKQKENKRCVKCRFLSELTSGESFECQEWSKCQASEYTASTGHPDNPFKCVDCYLTVSFCKSCADFSASCSECQEGYFLNSTNQCQKKCRQQEGWVHPNNCVQCRNSCFKCHNITLECIDELLQFEIYPFNINYKAVKFDTTLLIKIFTSVDGSSASKSFDITSVDESTFQDFFTVQKVVPFVEQESRKLQSDVKKKNLRIIQEQEKTDNEGEEAQIEETNKKSVEVVTSLLKMTNNVVLDLNLVNYVPGVYEVHIKSKSKIFIRGAVNPDYFINGTEKTVRLLKLLRESPEEIKAAGDQSKIVQKIIWFSGYFISAIYTAFVVFDIKDCHQIAKFIQTMHIFSKLRYINMLNGLVLEEFLAHLESPIHSSDVNVVRNLSITSDGRFTRYGVSPLITHHLFIEYAPYLISFLFKFVTMSVVNIQQREGRLISLYTRFVEYQRKIHTAAFNICCIDLVFFSCSTLVHLRNHGDWVSIANKALAFLLLQLILVDFLEVWSVGELFSDPRFPFQEQNLKAELAEVKLMQKGLKRAHRELRNNKAKVIEKESESSFESGSVDPDSSLAELKPSKNHRGRSRRSKKRRAKNGSKFEEKSEIESQGGYIGRLEFKYTPNKPRTVKFISVNHILANQIKEEITNRNILFKSRIVRQNMFYHTAKILILQILLVCTQRLFFLTISPFLAIEVALSTCHVVKFLQSNHLSSKIYIYHKIGQALYITCFMILLLKIGIMNQNIKGVPVNHQQFGIMILIIGVAFEYLFLGIFFIKIGIYYIKKLSRDTGQEIQREDAVLSGNIFMKLKIDERFKGVDIKARALVNQEEAPQQEESLGWISKLGSQISSDYDQSAKNRFRLEGKQDDSGSEEEKENNRKSRGMSKSNSRRDNNEASMDRRSRNRIFPSSEVPGGSRKDRRRKRKAGMNLNKDKNTLKDPHNRDRKKKEGLSSFGMSGVDRVCLGKPKKKSELSTGYDFTKDSTPQLSLLPQEEAKTDEKIKFFPLTFDDMFNEDELRQIDKVNLEKKEVEKGKRY